MAVHTYMALFIYHNKKENQTIANYYKMEILWLLLRHNLKISLFFIFNKIKKHLFLIKSK